MAMKCVLLAIVVCAFCCELDAAYHGRDAEHYGRKPSYGRVVSDENEQELYYDYRNPFERAGQVKPVKAEQECCAVYRKSFVPVANAIKDSFYKSYNEFQRVFNAKDFFEKYRKICEQMEKFAHMAQRVSPDVVKFAGDFYNQAFGVVNRFRDFNMKSVQAQQSFRSSFFREFQNYFKQMSLP